MTLTSCGEAPRAGEEPPGGPIGATRTPFSDCRAAERDRSVLRVAERDAYVEPQVLSGSGGGLLLAGSPTYEWFRGPSGALEYEENELFGVLRTNGSVQPIRRPTRSGPVATVRVAPLASGRLLWLLDEVTTMSFRDMRSVGVSFAEWEGGMWTHRGRLPIPDGSSYSFLASSDLVSHGGGLRWVLVTTSPRGETSVLDFVRTPGGWTSSVLDTLDVEDVSLAARGDSAWVALSGPDPSVGARSVRVGPIGSEARTLHVARPGDRIVGLTLRAGDTTVAASWVTIGTDDVRVAWAALDVDTDRPTVALLESDTEQAVPVTLSDGRVVWLTHRVDRLTFQQTLTVHVLPADAASSRIASLAYPFEGYFAATAVGSSEILVAGPETTSASADRIVRSLFVRLSIDCR